MTCNNNKCNNFFFQLICQLNEKQKVQQESKPSWEREDRERDRERETEREREREMMKETHTMTFAFGLPLYVTILLPVGSKGSP